MPAQRLVPLWFLNLRAENLKTALWISSTGTMYEGILKYYSGYLHRAKLIQKVYCGDIECLRVRDSLKKLHEEYLERLKAGEDRTRLSLEFAEKVHKKGFIFVYDPENVTCDNKRR